MRYFFHIGYNGFDYQGWQKLPQINSVQAVIETQLSRILKINVGIVGCGRTDAHVHASQFFFHADIDAVWEYDLVFRLNKNLPDNIAVFDIVPVDAEAHARFDAVSRTYNYFVHTYKDPFLSTLSSCYPGRDFNLHEMKRGVLLLLKYDDYRAFCKHLSVQRTTRCKVTVANLYADDKADNIRLEISANRFLSGMIRIIMQRLLQIGRGRMRVEEFEQLLISKETPEITRTAYPQGLYLSKVTYPYLDIASRSELFNTLADPDRWKKV